MCGCVCVCVSVCVAVCVCVCVCVCFPWHTHQGFPPGILAALERCTFDVELIEVFPAEHLAARDEPAALRVMLGQLSALHAPDAQVQLCGVRKTEELAAVVDDCMPALQHLDWLPVSWVSVDTHSHTLAFCELSVMYRQG